MGSGGRREMMGGEGREGGDGGRREEREEQAGLLRGGKHLNLRVCVLCYRLNFWFSL